MNGVVIVDKPAGLTSHDVVNRVRRILGQRSVGHLGTLDPLATGVLVLVTGSMTRLAQFYVASEKTYEGVIRFGWATDTYDAEGEPLGPCQDIQVSLEQLRELAASFRGVIEQLPPPFSAKKIHGVPAYRLARKQKEVPLKPVRVEIKEFDIVAVCGDPRPEEATAIATEKGKGTSASFRARVASGTYLRSVAHEMGRQLGCGAHLESLRRTEQAEFSIQSAHTLEDVAAAAIEHRLEDIFEHPRKLLPDFPSVTVNEEYAARIRAGRTVNLPELSRARLVKVFYGERELLAIVTRIAGTLFHPKIVFTANPSSQFVHGGRDG
jgi:tRNA pseudouridine55 synthase